MDIEEKINGIMQVRRNREQAGHIWLHGFHEIIDNARLNYKEVNDYINKKLSENPPFTKYHSSVQMLKIMQALLNDLEEPISIQDINFSSLLNNSNFIETIKRRMAKINFFYVHLPVNEKYHLEFPLINQLGLCRFIYTTCEKCEGLEEHGFPEIFLRKSVYFKDNAQNMYDNRVSVNHQPQGLMRESYKTLEDFINQCRVN